MKKAVLFFIVSLFIVSFTFATPIDVFVDINGAGEAETLDPHYAYDTASGEILNDMYDCLIMYVGDSTSEFAPMIASQVPSSDNGLINDDSTVYTFPIREGGVFHSGNPIRPCDVEYSFERGILYDPAGGPMWMIIEALSGGEFASVEAWFEGYSGMAYSDAVDENRVPVSDEAKEKLIGFYNDVIDPAIEVDGNNVKFTLTGPFAPFMNIVVHFNYWSSIIDAKACMEAGTWDGEADGWWKWHDLQPQETPLHVGDFGSGPFKLSEWDRAQQKIILERFDDYWREPAFFKTVIVQNIEEFSTRKSMIEAGDADIIYFPTSYLEQAQQLNDEGKVILTTGYPRAAITAIHFTWEVADNSEYIGSGKLDGKGVPPDFFSDIDIRKAFSYCYDGATFIDEVVNGLGRLVPTDLPEGFLGFDPTLPLPEFNLAKAAEYFKKAWNGEVWEKGFELTLLYNTGNEERQTAMEMIKFFVESINPKFKIYVQGEQWPVYLPTYKNGLLGCFVIGWNADYPDPHNFIATYYASNGVYGFSQGEAFLEFARENFDQLIKDAITASDPNVRVEKYKEIQEIAIENCVGIPLYMPLGINVRAPNVMGWFPHVIRSGESYYDMWKE